MIPYQKHKRNLTEKWVDDLNRHVSEVGIRVINRHIKRCSNHSSSGKWKSIPWWNVTSHLSVWLLTKKQPVMSIGEGTGKWESIRTVDGIIKYCIQNILKLLPELLYSPAIPLWGTYPKNMKTLILKDTQTLTSITAAFTINKTWKQPRCPSIDQWI